MHPIFTTRKEKLKRNPSRPAKKVTKLYRVKSRLGSIEFVHLYRAIDFLQKFDHEAKLFVITLFAYQQIDIRRLL